MSDLSQIFQNRNNVSQASSSYSPSQSLAEIVRPTMTITTKNRETVKSEIGLGLQLASLDSVIFKSKELTSGDISFLERVSSKYRKKHPLKLK